MSMILGKDNTELKIVLSDDEWPGVKRIAAKVADDIKLVTGVCPGIACESGQTEPKAGCIYAGTLGHSKLADSLAGNVDVSAVSKKREVFSFTTVEAAGGSALVILGSDKRGTIYGLFHISELLGVSPWVWFADAVPAHRDNVNITAADDIVSHEPSVEYRGLFINDEWPSYGNWTFEHFGGFTARMYEHVFELILRLKGNYLWPAMWTSNFSLDGPGMENAELADEMGIVMSNSHHEPCLRHSEEWDLVKGDDTPYGSAWNFDRNREGLTNYWRDGLKRNGHLENIITMGMRGERDSEIMGAEATLKDNIDYIKEVVEVQNDLIRETIDPDLSRVPRMIAIYKEVEKYYLGDETIPGLRTWDGLNGITCMLCEDNHGNMRGLPAEEERDRDGGFGMYYHFDYHGGPISYEWINSTTLAKTWEQMSEAYEAGVRKIWIVNTGDLKPQELPISFFFDLAYDYDKWGASNTSSATDYLSKWVKEQFGGYADTDRMNEIEELIDGYTYINLCRKPEALQPDTYHPFNYGESTYMLRMAADLYRRAAVLSEVFEDTPVHDAYEELVGYPVRAAANLLYMQLSAGRNAALARMACPSANIYARYVDECFEADSVLTQMYHDTAEGKWNKIMSSEHIGFVHWNEEESRYPLRTLVYPYRKPRMIVRLTDSDRYTMGEDWTRQTLYAVDLIDPACEQISVTIENGGAGKLSWKAQTECEWVSLSSVSGTLSEPLQAGDDRLELDMLREDPLAETGSVCELKIGVDRLAANISPGEVKTALITVTGGPGHVDIVVAVAGYDPDVYTPEGGMKKRIIPVIPEKYTGDISTHVLREFKKNTLGLVIDADDTDGVHDAGGGRFVTISPYGKYRTAIKAYPVDAHFNIDNAPSVSYSLYAPEAGAYDVTLITAPSNPIDGSGRLRVGMQINDGPAQVISMVGDNYMGGENSCPEWCVSALDQEHRKTVTMQMNSGDNKLSIYAVDPGVVPERILIRKSGTEWADGYMGRIGRK